MDGRYRGTVMVTLMRVCTCPCLGQSRPNREKGGIYYVKFEHVEQGGDPGEDWTGILGEGSSLELCDHIGMQDGSW
jgi:hypothetical protein